MKRQQNSVICARGGGANYVIDIDIAKSKCPVTVKKFWGLEHLMNRYDYIAAIDCECEFLRSFEPGKVLREIWESRSFLTANKSDASARKINKDCAELLGLGNGGSRIRQQTEDYLYYWWFNEIPVYRTETLGEFFSWLDEGTRREAVFSNWCCFDYIVYVMWLIECKGFSLRRLDIASPFGITEGLYSSRGLSGFENTNNIHWTSRGKISPEDRNVVMRFHLDRWKNHSSWFGRFKRAVKYVLRLRR